MLTKSNNVILRIDEKISKYRFLSGNMLKFIAFIAMVLDHFGKIFLSYHIENVLFPQFEEGAILWEQVQTIDYFSRFTLTGIGSIAFPIFCFLLNEGFCYTKNKKRYIISMLVFAIISELPFDIAFFSSFSTIEGTYPFYWGYQNVFFTLTFALLTLLIFEKINNSLTKFTPKKFFFMAGYVGVMCILVEILKFDYGLQGILYVVGFYIFRQNRIYQVLIFLIIYSLTTGNVPTHYILSSSIIMLFYNNTRGKIKIKYWGYVFYPLHIIIIYITTIIYNNYMV